MTNPVEKVRTLLFSTPRQVEQEIMTRVETYIRFTEQTEDTLEPLNRKEMEIAKVGAALGARVLRELMAQGHLKLVKREDLQAVTEYVEEIITLRKQQKKPKN